MIADNIKNFNIETLPEILRRGIDILRTTDFSQLEAGVYPVDGDNLLYHVQEYDTSDWTEVKAEIHKKYCDIQYMVSGQEIIGWAPFVSDTDISSYDSDNDIAFFEAPEQESKLKMNIGDFAFFAPYEIHRPRLNYAQNQSTKVKKVVVKIKAEAL